MDRRVRVVVALSRARRREFPVQELLRVGSPVIRAALHLNQTLEVGSRSENRGFRSRIAGRSAADSVRT